MEKVKPSFGPGNFRVATVAKFASKDGHCYNPDFRTFYIHCFILTLGGPTNMNFVIPPYFVHTLINKEWAEQGHT